MEEGLYLILSFYTFEQAARKQQKFQVWKRRLLELYFSLFRLILNNANIVTTSIFTQYLDCGILPSCSIVLADQKELSILPWIASLREVDH